MNDPTPDDNLPLDADLIALTRQLDALAQADRAAASAGFESRLLARTLAAATKLEPALSQLAADDRVAARAGLEARVAEASVHKLGAASPQLHLSEASRSHAPAARRSSPRRLLSRRVSALAAMLTIACAGGLVLFAMRGQPAPTPGLIVSVPTDPTDRSSQLAAQLESNMSSLFSAIDSVPTTPTEQIGMDVQSDWIDEPMTGSTSGRSL